MVQAVNDSLTIANELRPVLLWLSRHLRRESHELGLTAGQVTILSTIQDRPGITAQELATRQQISAPAMSGQLARLEETGLVTRERGHDRRRMRVTVTAEGRRVLRTVRKRRNAWLAERLERLEPRERAAVQAAIGPLARLLEVAADAGSTKSAKGGGAGLAGAGARTR
jgi:DNA-binding MarR family transcriptional regulator